MSHPDRITMVHPNGARSTIQFGPDTGERLVCMNQKGGETTTFNLDDFLAGARETAMNLDTEFLVHDRRTGKLLSGTGIIMRRLITEIEARLNQKGPDLCPDHNHGAPELKHNAYPCVRCFDEALGKLRELEKENIALRGIISNLQGERP